MRTTEIKDGPVDVRLDPATDRICLVFEARDAAVRLFRTMPRDEAAAFHQHLGQVLGKAA